MRRSMNPVKKYEELTTAFISKLEAVDGPFEDFVEGLKLAESELKARRQAAESELREQQRDAERASAASDGED